MFTLKFKKKYAKIPLEEFYNIKNIEKENEQLNNINCEFRDQLQKKNIIIYQYQEKEKQLQQKNKNYKQEIKRLNNALAKNKEKLKNLNRKG